jgi:hypothetical protein
MQAGRGTTFHRSQHGGTLMADNLVNQSLDRRREERAAEQLIQDNVTRLADLATTNMDWQKYFGFGAQVAHYWADAFNAAQNSIGQTISTMQSRRAA